MGARDLVDQLVSVAELHQRPVKIYEVPVRVDLCDGRVGEIYGFVELLDSGMVAVLTNDGLKRHRLTPMLWFALNAYACPCPDVVEDLEEARTRLHDLVEWKRL